MQVRDMMSKDVEVIGRNDDLQAVQDRMAARQIRHAVVVEAGEIVGVVTQRDLFKAALPSAMGYGEKARNAYLKSVRVKEIMNYPVLTVSPTTTVAEAADLMVQKGIGCLPVVESNTPIGMVTKTDFLRHLSAMSSATGDTGTGTA